MPAGRRMLRSRPGQGAAAPGGVLRSGTIGWEWDGLDWEPWSRLTQHPSDRSRVEANRASVGPPLPASLGSFCGRRAACTTECGAPPCMHPHRRATARPGRRCLRLRAGPLALCRCTARGGAVRMPPGCPPAPLSAVRLRLSGLLVPARRLQPTVTIKLTNAPRATWRIGAAWASSSREAADHELHGSDQHQASPRHKSA